MTLHRLKRFWLLAPLAIAASMLIAVACGSETTVVETVIVEKQVTQVETVVETVVVEKQVEGETVRVVETVVVEKPVTRIEKVIETVVVEKQVEGETVRVVETVVVEKAVTVTERVVETVVVDRVVTEVATVIVEVDKVVEKLLVATPTPSGETVMPKPAKVPQGTMTIAARTVGKPHGDPEKCIPACGNEKFTLGIYETMMGIDERANVLPRLAESWTVADDLSYVDFKLTEGVPFHRGWGTVTAEDVAWGFNRASSGTNPDSVHDQAGQFAGLYERWDALDDLNVRMTVATLSVGALRWSLSPFWQSMGIHSKALFDQVGPEGIRDLYIGTGPFEAREWVEDQHAILNAVDGHWRKTPEMAQVRVLAVPDPVVRATMLRTGEADAAQVDTKDIPALKAEGFVADPTSSWMQGIFYGGNYWEATLHKTGEPVNAGGYDPSLPWVGEYGNDASMEQARKVREAMSRTIDRVGINESVVENLGFPTYVPMVSVRSPDYDDKWTVEYEPARGKALLEEAGFADGFDVDLWGGGEPGSGTGREITEAIAAAWQNELGLNVTLDATEYSAHRPKTVEFTWNQLQFRIARDTNSALTLDLPKGGHASTVSQGGSICAGNLIPKFTELYNLSANETEADVRRGYALELINYAQEWWLETGVIEIPNFALYSDEKIKAWPRPLAAFAGSAIWANLEEITWEP